MKEWWNNLALREKQLVAAGVFFVALFLIYTLLWSPLENKITNLRNQIQRNQELLVWMRDTEKRIHAIESTSQQKTKTQTGSLLSIVQKQIKQSEFAGSLNQLHQVETNSVELIFYKIDFDKLMNWLIKFTQQQGLIITQMSITPSATPGIVAANLTITSSNK